MFNIELQPFCSVDETRMAINTPFAFNGWKYATDGRICVRIQTSEPDDSNEPYKRPDASAMFKDFSVDGLEAFEIPVLDGVKEKRCPFCNGNGYSTCNMGHDHECEDCDKTGVLEEWPKKEVGGQTFSERYLSKIINLPGLQFYPTSAGFAEDGLSHAGKPAFFTFNNGQGLLMPIRKEGK